MAAYFNDGGEKYELPHVNPRIFLFRLRQQSP